MSSSRLPGKMLMQLGGLPLFEWVCRRCMTTGSVKKVVLATSEDESDTLLADKAVSLGFQVFRGSLNNVLDRYIRCAKSEKAEVVVRVCGDSPFVDTGLIKRLLDIYINNDLDYVSVDKETCTAGLDAEVVGLDALEKILSLSSDPDDLEHVTRHIRNHPDLYRVRLIDAGSKLCNGNLSLTVDTEDDLKMCDCIARSLNLQTGAGRFDFTTDDIARIVGELC